MGNLKSITAGLYLVAAAIGLTSITAGETRAALLGVDLAEVAGVDTLLTRDTATGLDWLDVDITIGKSFDEVNMASMTFASLGGLNPITDLGFRHATLAEVETLLTNAGIFPVNDPTFTVANFAPVEALKALLGPTVLIGMNTESTQGITLDGPSAGTHFRASFGRCLASCAAGPSGRSFNFPLAGSIASNQSTPGGGHFLVRSSQAIPEPGTLVLLGFGLLGLGLARRRRTV